MNLQGIFNVREYSSLGKKEKKRKVKKKRNGRKREKGSTRGVAYGEGSSMNVFESFVS